MTPPGDDRTAADVRVLAEAYLERRRQDAKWGPQSHPDGTGGFLREAVASELRAACDAAFTAGQGTWRHILDEEVAEAFAETDLEKLKEELIQVIAVSTNWCADIDRKLAARAADAEQA